nr:hypothetical protein [uncultured Sphaerochaeta sp.]
MNPVSPGLSAIGNVPEGMQPFILARLVERALSEGATGPASLVFVARDGRRMQRLADVLPALMPGHTILTLPAWDCLPYDRVSPNAVTLSARMATLAALTDPMTKGAIVLTSVNALVQALPPRDVVATMSFSAKAGAVVDSERLIAWAAGNGYLRVPTVREAGEYAVRGGLVDLFAAGMEAPLRFDFFGSTLETIRSFDPESQRSTGSLKSISLSPMSEVMLTPETIRHFRGRYTSTFGGNTADDQLYAAISAGQRFPGMEHWLPFFYDRLDPLAAYTGPAQFVFDDQSDHALAERQDQVADYYEARESARTGDNPAGATVYKPVPAETLYQMSAGLAALAGGQGVVLSPFASEDSSENAGGRMPPNFAAERGAADTNLFEAGGQAHRRTRQKGPARRCRRLVRRHPRTVDATAGRSRVEADEKGRELARRRNDAARHHSLRHARARNRLRDRCHPGLVRTGHSRRTHHPPYAAQEGGERPDRGVEPRRR